MQGFFSEMDFLPFSHVYWPYIEGHTLKIPIAKTKPRVIPLTTKALKLLEQAELPFKITKWQVSKTFRKLCNV